LHKSPSQNSPSHASPRRKKKKKKLKFKQKLVLKGEKEPLHPEDKKNQDELEGMLVGKAHGSPAK
jgi:hypothetical protein